MELLEGREVPAVFKVTNLNDGGAGSLRAAIVQANNSSDADVIKFEVIGSIALTDGELSITSNVTIVGPGSGFLTIDGQGLDGDRIFRIGTEGTVVSSISGMKLINGNVEGTGGGIYCSYNTDLTLSDVIISNCSSSRGGAIDMDENTKLTIDNCVLTGNSSFNRGGAIFMGDNSVSQIRNSTISGNESSGSGGGMYLDTGASLSVERCTIAGNTALPTKGTPNGGGLFVARSTSLNIQDSTISGNSATRSGGGIYISGTYDQQNGLGFTINNSTISGNTANASGGGIYIGANQTPSRPAGGYAFTNPAELLHCTVTGNVVPTIEDRQASFGSGGGVATGIEIDVVNSIIAGNTSDSDPDITTFDSGNLQLSFSLIQDVGSASFSDNGGNIFDTDPVLGPLASNGGPTQTHALLANSPAINAGDPAFQNPPDAPVTDQRGGKFARVVFGTTDMGAYEVQESGPQPVTVHLHAVGAGAGSTAEVKVFDSEGNVVADFDAYPFFTGGVRVAVADIDGDGVDDVITSPGPNGGPHIQVFNGAKLLNGEAERIVSSIGSFFSYNPFFRGGVYVAAADVNGDGKPDIITGADAGGGPHVIAWDNVTGDAIVSFYAYAASFHGGVRVAGGDIDGDGKAEIITGAGAGGGPHMRVFDSSGAVVKENFAFSPSFLGGIYVAAGDVNGDGKADIIVGAGAGGGPHVKVFSGVDLAVLRSFYAYDPAWSGGVRVSSFDFDGDGRADIITGAGPGGGPHAIAYSGLDNEILGSAYIWDLPFPFGIFVA